MIEKLLDSPYVKKEEFLSLLEKTDLFPLTDIVYIHQTEGPDFFAHLLYHLAKPKQKLVFMDVSGDVTRDQVFLLMQGFIEEIKERLLRCSYYSVSKETLAENNLITLSFKIRQLNDQETG